MSPERILIDPGDIEEIEIFVRTFARQVVSGEHRSVFSSSLGFDLVGIRDIQPDDPKSRIDWARSTLTGFSPLQVHEHTAERSLDIIVCADASLSTRCGGNGVTVAYIIARTLTILGASAILFNDRVGLITFGADENKEVLPRQNRDHLFYLLSEYSLVYSSRLEERPKLNDILASFVQQPSLIVVVSDFMFRGVLEEIQELAYFLDSHDVMLVVIDNSFAFDVHINSAAWVLGEDVESGERITASLSKLQDFKQDVVEFQESVISAARALGIDCLFLRGSTEDQQTALCEFFFEKRFQM